MIDKLKGLDYKLLEVFVEVLYELVKECDLESGLFVCLSLLYGCIKFCVVVIEWMKGNEVYVLMYFVSSEIVVNLLILSVGDVWMKILVYK